MTAAIALFAFGAVTTLLSLMLHLGTLRAPDSGFFPLVLGVLLMVLAAIHGVQLHLAKAPAPPAAPAPPVAPAPPAAEGSTLKVVLFVGAVALATALFDTLGYTLVSFLLMLGLLQVLGVRKWYVSGGIALVSAAAAQVVFVHWLKIPLPAGWLSF